MRRGIDAVTGAELWMEIAAGLTVYHIDELDDDGSVLRSAAVSDSGKAKALWVKAKARAAARVAEKGAGA